jgi:3'(2'), 5'-bisphosphate nucleotidase
VIESDDHLLAHELAARTGLALLQIRERYADGAGSKAEMKDAADQTAHAIIVAELTRLRPDDAVLSEEGRDDLSRLNALRTWIVDPLDGTREFSEPPRDDWAVHIALVIDGQPTAGAVALPAQSVTLSTAHAPTLAGMSPDAPRVVVSRTRRPQPAVDLAAALEARYIEMGSAGAKAMAIIQGRADIYAHSGGQYEWDNCAPVAVARAVGLHCSRLDGSPLVYNNADPYLPDLLICRPEYADAVIAAIAAAGLS